VRWRLTPAGRRVIEAGSRRVSALSAPRPAWDGPLAGPGDHRAEQPAGLAAQTVPGSSWAGFGNPTAGTWVTPNAEAVAPAAEVVEDLGLSPWCLSFAGRGLDIGLTDQDIVDQAWDLDAIAQHYAESLSRFTNVPVTDGDEALFTQVALVNELQRFRSWTRACRSSCFPPTGSAGRHQPASRRCGPSGTMPPTSGGASSRTDSDSGRAAIRPRPRFGSRRASAADRPVRAMESALRRIGPHPALGTGLAVIAAADPAADNTPANAPR